MVGSGLGAAGRQEGADGAVGCVGAARRPGALPQVLLLQLSPFPPVRRPAFPTELGAHFSIWEHPPCLFRAHLVAPRPTPLPDASPTNGAEADRAVTAKIGNSGEIPRPLVLKQQIRSGGVELRKQMELSCLREEGEGSLAPFLTYHAVKTLVPYNGLESNPTHTHTTHSISSTVAAVHQTAPHSVVWINKCKGNNVGQASPQDRSERPVASRPPTVSAVRRCWHHARASCVPPGPLVRVRGGGGVIDHCPSWRDRSRGTLVPHATEQERALQLALGQDPLKRLGRVIPPP